MKKTIFIFTVSLLVLSFSSCESWLDVNPKSEIKADKLFDTETGFKDALIGLYIGMTDPDAYGRNLSWQAIEFMAGQYQNANNSLIELQKYNYAHSSSKDFIDGVWAKEYNIISESNLLLESLEKKGSILNPTLYQVIQGEALAVRAMCHFDLIRLFAKGNLARNKTALTEPCIPYVTKYSKEITGQLSYENTLKLLHQDLDSALICLKSDPLYPEEITRPDDYEDITDDIFFSGTYYKGRETRLSYLAVLLLNARVYLWEGNETKALENAETLIKAYEKLVNRGELKWATESNYVDADQENVRDYVFQGELLFALEAQKLETYLGDVYSESHNGSSNYDRLLQTEEFVQDIFAASLATESDLRFKKQWEAVKGGYLTVKIRKTTGSYFTNYLPLMRISEAYLIAAECLKETNKEQAVKYLNFLKEKRNIAPRYFLSTDKSAEELQQEIILDYRREFSQEGQLFFCYKRLGLKTFAGLQYLGDEMTDSQYQVPYPDNEQELGQRQ